ncbi:MAG TPA: molecular chaperone, partial [Cyanobacteria bacterium UBA11049]|nr:molecular chaperone [Cyanobacteria bacterium UBA11049]
VRWEPFREFEGLQRDMNRLFDGLARAGDSGLGSDIAFMPAAEIQETPEAIHLKLEVPGMEAKD